MLKQLTVWLFLFAVFTADFSRLSVYAGFALNHEYISSKLCENRDKPWLHCNGKCYLMKKVREAEENENNKTAKSNLSRLEVSFFQKLYTLQFQPQAILADHNASFANYAFLYSSQHINSIFRPPKKIA